MIASQRGPSASPGSARASRGLPACATLALLLAAGAAPGSDRDAPDAGTLPSAARDAEAGPRSAGAGDRVQRPSLGAPLARIAEVVRPEGERRLDAGDHGSPRAALLRFLEAAGAGRFTEAAAQLDLPPGTDPEEARRAARHLKAVLDRQPIAPEKLSARPEGDVEDGLPAGVDELVRIPAPGGASASLRLSLQPALSRWLFTRRTVELADGLFAQLPNRGLLDRLPAPLLAEGPLGVAFWQWLALPALLLLAFLGAELFGGLAVRLLLLIARRTVTPWDDALVANNAGPVKLVCGVAVLDWLLPWVGLSAAAHASSNRLLNAALAFSFFWAALRSVDVARTLLASGKYQSQPSAAAFLQFGARLAKLLFGLLAVVGVLTELGYPAGSLLAGLGLGGLALALAAQKTVENLLGALSIGLDQPFRVGDWVRIEGVEGGVEGIGLRSTRIRTLERTLVTIPNGRLAELRTESLAARDRLLLATSLLLPSDASVAQVRAVIAGCERLLRVHPAIFPEDLRVHLKGFGPASLEIEINAWFRTASWMEFLPLRQEVLLAFLEVVEQAGTRLAVQAHAVRLVQGEAPRR